MNISTNMIATHKNPQSFVGNLADRSTSYVSLMSQGATTQNQRDQVSHSHNLQHPKSTRNAASKPINQRLMNISTADNLVELEIGAGEKSSRNTAQFVVNLL